MKHGEDPVAAALQAFHHHWNLCCRADEGRKKPDPGCFEWAAKGLSLVREGAAVALAFGSQPVRYIKPSMFEGF